jgi:hypothetical protein
LCFLLDRHYDQQIIGSNRSYFDLSIGIRLTLNIPYKQAQVFDNNESDSGLAKTFKELILELKRLIDNN